MPHIITIQSEYCFEYLLIFTLNINKWSIILGFLSPSLTRYKLSVFITVTMLPFLSNIPFLVIKLLKIKFYLRITYMQKSSQVITAQHDKNSDSCKHHSYQEMEHLVF